MYKGNYLSISLRKSIFKIDINKKESISQYDFKLSKIYLFNNNIFGIYQNGIYRITDKDNTINAIFYANLKKKTIFIVYIKLKKKN